MGPRHLFSAWKEFADCWSHKKRAALFTDFDGTLVPIRRDASRSRLSRPVLRVLSLLAEKGVLLGVISGRGLADISGRIQVRGAWIGAEHGFFLRSPGNRVSSSLTRSKQRKVARVASRLRAACAGLPGIRVEHKRATVAVHYRVAPAAAQRAAARALANVLASERGLLRLNGKRVWEVAPSPGTDKWQALRRILAQAKWSGRGALIVYLGDDTTDESVFRELDGFSIAVGKRRRTAARYWLESPAEVRRFLERWSHLAS